MIHSSKQQRPFRTRDASTPSTRSGRAVLPWVIMLVLWCVGLFIVAGPRLAGYDFFGARGDSMEPAISSGSLLVTEQVSRSEVRAGDIIVFPARWNGTAMTSHRVISIQRHGKITLAITKGDANQIADTPHVVQDASVVRVSKIIPYAATARR